MSVSKSNIGLVAVVLTIGAFYWLHHSTRGPVQTPASANQKATQAHPSEALSPQDAVAVSAPSSTNESKRLPVISEETATIRMYVAHAPLRTRVIADPDSDKNRQILQIMVGKALARSGAVSPTPAPASK